MIPTVPNMAIPMAIPMAVPMVVAALELTSGSYGSYDSYGYPPYRNPGGCPMSLLWPFPHLELPVVPMSRMVPMVPMVPVVPMFRRIPMFCMAIPMATPMAGPTAVP